MSRALQDQVNFAAQPAETGAASQVGAVPRPADSDAPLRYVYVSAVAHSGTTLLACLLAPHPQISTVGELHHKTHPGFNCSCGVPLNECAFWLNWQRRANERGLAFELGDLGVGAMPYRPQSFADRLYVHQWPRPVLDRFCRLGFRKRSPARRRVETAVARSVALARLLCEIEGTNVFLDTSKIPHQAPLLAERPDVDLKMIALVRDGRAVVHSLIRKERLTPDQAIDAFIWTHCHMQRAADRLPADRVLTIKLREICFDPAAALQRIQQFMGVDPASDLAATPASRHVIGNGMRVTFDGAIRYDENWKRDLSSDHLALFQRRAGWLNRQLGYDE